MKFQATRGTKDILPPDSLIWRRIEETAYQVFKQYGYEQIITPIFEQTELFSRGIGSTTEIVMKEMYSFKDKGKRNLTLRPEGTAPIIRAYLEAGLGTSAITKWYYFGPMFRQERPQAGRYREFYQIGVEAIGSEEPIMDSELIVMAAQFLKKLELENFVINLSSVGCPICRPVLRERLKGYFSSFLNELCSDCQQRYKRNVLRILDCKNEKCNHFFKGLPSVLETLCHACRDHFNMVCEYLDKVGLTFKVSPYLVRGLDYYTRTTFEIVSPKLGAHNSLCGGGRYDYLVKELGGPAKPAVGFAIGVERLINVLNEEKISLKNEPENLFYFIGLGLEAKQKVFFLANLLREKGKKVEIACDGRRLKNQLRQADRQGARYVLIIGEEELKQNQISFKDMQDGQQEIIKLENFEQWASQK